MHRFCTLILILGSILEVSPVTAADLGSLEGTVRFGGSGQAAATEAVVYLVGDGLAAVHRTPAVLAALDQKDITYVPHVLPVLAGRTVEIRNSDNILHNVHTYSKANEAFNFAQLGGMTRSHTFRKPEVIHVGCDVHSQMSAYVVVLDNPFFAKPDKSGKYSIPEVPPGSFSVRAWHEKYGTIEVGQAVAIAAGKPTALDVTFEKEQTP